MHGLPSYKHFSLACGCPFHTPHFSHAVFDPAQLSQPQGWATPAVGMEKDFASEKNQRLLLPR